VYKDAATAVRALEAGKESVGCTQGTVGSNSDAITFSSPKDVSSQLNVAEALEIDFESAGVTGQLIAVHKGDTVVAFQFGTVSSGSSRAPDAFAIAKKGLKKLGI
jgi:hypothetical protein